MSTPAVIRVAHSPDADDAFMFYALAEHKIDTEGLVFEHVLKDIETLNREAAEGTYELTAISYHAYAYLHDRYAIFPVGSSIGEQYGPVLVAKTPMGLDEILASGKPVAIPGEQTSAYLFLKLYCPEIPTVKIHFDDIPQAVLAGEVIAGLVIHESQVTYREEGLHKIVDLGEWWFEKTGLVLPLGCNGIRRDLGEALIQKICRVLYRSVKWGLDHRAETLAGCQVYARDLAPEKTDQFVAMYVNDLTLAITPEIRQAVTLMLQEGYEKGLIPQRITPDFIEFEAFSDSLLPDLAV
ncbi:MAG: ABC transporter substrate-binding protein [Vampirovibrio sp.]